jgi:hypothetical protein
VAEVDLDETGQRALREAENFCWRGNVAILAPEHLLAGALVVLANHGVRGLPSTEQLEAGLAAIHGTGTDTLKDNVMWGSGARTALNATAGAIRQAGGDTIDARIIAIGAIATGEVNPMFYGSAGTSREELIRLIDEGEPA